jgi:hypothetical protein
MSDQINKEFTVEKVRHIPRNQYKHCDVDPLLRYLYKYNFDRYCVKFICRDIEIGAKEIFTDILDVANWLVQHSVENGIPVIENGFVCYFNDNQAGKGDPYFVCSITLDRFGMSTIKDRKGDLRVYSVRS